MRSSTPPSWVHPTYDVVDGGSPATLPADAGVWTPSTSGTGARSLTWEVESGDWTLVVMNADGHAPVTAEAAEGATLPALGTTIGVLLVSGGVLLLVALALLVGGLVSASRVGCRACTARVRATSPFSISAHFSQTCRKSVFPSRTAGA